MYKLYEYKTERSMPEGAPIISTIMEYITDDSDNVIYYNIQNTLWLKAVGIELIPDDSKLTLKKSLTKKEVEKMVFLDSI